MEVGRRPSSIVRSSPLIKGSNLNKVRGYPFGTVYGRPAVGGGGGGGIEEKQINRIVEEEQEQIYQVPEANNHITTIPLRTPPPPIDDKIGSSIEATTDKNNHLHVATSCPPFAHRNNSMRSPRQASKLDKSQTTSSINTLRRESDMVRKASRTPSGGNISQKGDSAWPGSKLAGKVDSAKTPSIRSYWEHNIHKEQLEREETARTARPKTYGFPKWRSSDALSASLVASNSVDIPKDSRIPEDRLKKMEQTDKEAMVVKQHIHQSIEPTRPLHKGKSLDSLVQQEQQHQQQQQSWYDREKIREGVSRESIANIHEARQRFESGDFNHRERSFSSASCRPEPVPPPLPPKSEEIILRQAAQRYSECQDSVDSYPVSNYRNTANNQNSNGSANITREHNFLFEQQLLLLYFKQNPEIVNSIGISVSEAVRQLIEEIPFRRVEIRQVDDDMNQWQYSPNNQKLGRYIKKAQFGPNAPRFRKNDPSRERQEDIRPGESIVAAEIRHAREREEELRRSRSELGLPTLEDTIDSWRHGNRGFSIPNQLRSAMSYDHIHQNGVQKTPSMGEISHESYGSYSRNDHGSRTDLRRPGYGPTPYRLHNTDDQDVMFYGPTRRQLPQLKRFD
ncbi:unnamed protein product [Auanema sp. JU1783]|nr:unnamed protein product [Auanema sp. JU1783]